MIAAAGVAVLALVLGALVVLTGGGDDDDDARGDFAADGAIGDAATFEAMCDDPRGDEDVPAYTGTPGYHGIEIWVPDAEFPDKRTQFRPDDAAWNVDTRLVACVEMTGSEFGEACTGYDNGGTVEAHNATYEITVYQVYDGSEVEKGTLQSGDECPMSDWFITGEGSPVYYRAPSGVEDFLRPIVAVPDETGTVPTSAPAGGDQPVPSDPACAQPPFPFVLNGLDGEGRTLDLTYAYALEFQQEPRLRVVMTDFPLDPDALATGLPTVPEGGTMATLGFSPTNDRYTGSLDLATGDVVESSAFTDGSTTMNGSLSFGGRSGSGPTGTATVTFYDTEFLCLDINMPASGGAGIVGRVSAAVIQVDDELFVG
jgi:hypothetical protein